MKRNLLGAAVLAWLVGSSVYTVDASEVAVVTLFGKPIATVTEPGLRVRAPWPVHQVVRFDARSRLLSVKPAEVLTKDKKNLVVEAFVVWKVSDAEHFLEAVGSAQVAETQLSDLVVSRIAAGLGQRNFQDLMVVGGQSSDMLPEGLAEQVSQVSLERLGVEVVDVRLRHVGLPLQNEQSIYARMRAERSRIANAYRSEGQEKAVVIRAEADRQAAEILAGAQRQAAEIRAKAEGSAARVYAQAYAKDPEFYRFMRRLEAYEQMLDEDTTLVVESDGVLFGALQGEVR
jgi:membrane protease subunit HflC